MAISRRKMKTENASTFPETGQGLHPNAIQARLDDVDWTKVHADLDAQGWAVVPKLLTDAEADPSRIFTLRSRVSAAISSWLDTVSVGVNTSISAIPCRL